MGCAMTKKRIRNSFLTPLDVRVMPSGKRFMLLYPFTYYWKRYGIKISVPAGFVSDFASIPRLIISFVALGAILAGHFLGITWLLLLGVAVEILLVFLTKLGRWNKPAVLHDYLYRNHWVKLASGGMGFFPRQGADQLFLDAMTDRGVAKWKRTVMWVFVRAFGFLSWGK